MPQISRQEFERLPLRVHNFLAGVPLHDVWSIDLRRRRPAITLDDFLRNTNARPFKCSPVVRALMSFRLLVGRLLGWDREPVVPEIPSEITQPNVRAYIHDVTRPTPTLKSPVRWEPDADRFFEAATALRDLEDLGRGWSEVVLGCNAPPTREGFSAGDAHR